MTRESCFQIVKIPENQNFEGQVDAQGRYKLNSTLPKLKISKNGSFAGNLLTLVPGKYTIFPQLFDTGFYQTSNMVFMNSGISLTPYASTKTTLFPRNAKDKSHTIIHIPENSKQIVLIDIGEVIILPSSDN
jgi:hypothetical protein